MDKIGKVLILITVLVCGSCNTVSMSFIDFPMLWTNPSPFPDFVRNVFVASVNNEAHLCMSINQEPLWVYGNEYDMLNDHLTSTARLTFNDLEIIDQLQIEIYDLINSVRDTNGWEIGSYGGDITLCQNIESLPRGMYVVTLHLTNTNDEEFIFALAIINDNHGINLPEQYLP